MVPGSTCRYSDWNPTPYCLSVSFRFQSGQPESGVPTVLSLGNEDCLCCCCQTLFQSDGLSGSLQLELDILAQRFLERNGDRLESEQKMEEWVRKTLILLDQWVCCGCGCRLSGWGLLEAVDQQYEHLWVWHGRSQQ